MPLLADYVVLGGGNAMKLKGLPEGARLGDNMHAFSGGFHLWEEAWQDERPACILQKSPAGVERKGARQEPDNLSGKHLGNIPCSIRNSIGSCS